MVAVAGMDCLVKVLKSLRGDPLRIALLLTAEGTFECEEVSHQSKSLQSFNVMFCAEPESAGVVSPCAQICVCCFDADRFVGPLPSLHSDSNQWLFSL